MPSFSARQCLSLAAQAARQRAEIWSAVVTLSTDPVAQQLPVAKSPNRANRMADESRAGYIERTLATFAFPASWFDPTFGGRLSSTHGYDDNTIALGTRVTVVSDAACPANAGTTWQIFDLKTSDTGTELRATAFRLDA